MNERTNIVTYDIADLGLTEPTHWFIFPAFTSSLAVYLLVIIEIISPYLSVFPFPVFLFFLM